MTGIAALLVIASGIMHACWNLLAKRSGHKASFLWFCQWVAIAAFAPWTVRSLLHGSWDGRGWYWVALSMMLHGLYTVLLARTYDIGDLSQAYPIMRGTAPTLVPLIGVLFLHEHLTSIGWVGIAVIVSGILAMNGGISRRGGSRQLVATGYALGVGLCITAYLLVDKLAMGHVRPVVLNEASNAANMLALSLGSVRATALRGEWIRNRGWILLAGAAAPAGYLLFLYALSLTPISVLAPLREIGTVLAVVLGVWLLEEGNGRRRLFAAAWITAGICLLGFWG